MYVLISENIVFPFSIMSRGLSNAGGGGFAALRDYGSTSNNIGGAAAIPDINFAGFSPTEFISLSENIAQNVTFVKNSWQALERLLKRIGTSRDSMESREKV